jgi:hypothetical protein
MSMEFVIARAKEGCGCIRFAAVTKCSTRFKTRESEIEWMGELAKDIKKLKRQGSTPDYTTEPPTMGGCVVCDPKHHKAQADLFAAAPGGQHPEEAE